MKSNKTPAAPAFAIADPVTLTWPDTPVLTGTVVDKTPTGWYIVQLTAESIAALDAHEPNGKRHKEGRCSARAKTMSLTTTAAAVLTPSAVPADDEQLDELPPEEGDEEKPEHPMAAALRKARVRYVKTKRPEGSASADCGDMLAKALRDLEPLEVAAMADKVLGEAPGFHAAKYGHLNNGQIRMNSGNRIRAFLKTADEDGLNHAYRCLGWEEAEEDLDEEGDEE